METHVLKGRITLVTGGSIGIGSGSAKRLIEGRRLHNGPPQEAA